MSTDNAPDTSAAPGPALPLSMAAVGQQVVLAEIRGGRRLRHRLAEMGLTPATRFRVVAKGNPGPIIIDLRDSRLVLGRGMVHRVFVRGA